MNSDVKPRLGWGFCGSFCTISRAVGQLEVLSAVYDTVPVINSSVAGTDTRFGKASELILRVTEICGKAPIMTVEDAEPLGPATPLDLMLIAPCTGNTLAKIANGITDTPVTMAAKAHLRRERPLLLALASNDALAGGFVNLASLARRKCVFFVPLVQDDPVGKPNSLVCSFNLIPEALNAAAHGEQLRPLFV